MNYRGTIFREMEDLRRSMERLFSDIHGSRRPVSRFAFLPGLAARQYPLINIFDDEDKMYVECLAPGLDPDELEVTVENNLLTIRGQKNSRPADLSPEAYHRSERAAGKFARTVEIGREIDPDSVKAEYRHGLLLVTLGKTEKAKPRRIQISSGE